MKILSRDGLRLYVVNEGEFEISKEYGQDIYGIRLNGKLIGAFPTEEAGNKTLKNILTNSDYYTMSWTKIE